jgi:DNA polymerase-3 subunit alpha
MPDFIHLHNHSHYSLLDAISTTYGLVDEAVKNNMPAVALTDHGVMYGAMEFYKYAKKKNIKPIIGVETYVAQTGSRHDRGEKLQGRRDYVSDDAFADNSDTLSAPINYAHLILLAKNETGYKNLLKLVSIGHTEGFYYKPRIDLEVLNQYREGLVALSACAGGVISCYLTRNDLKKAREMTGIYKDIFGEDFYLELQNHITLDSEKLVLREMPKIAKEFGLKLIATNDVHYIKQEHSVAHNIYLHLSAKQNKNYDPAEVTRVLRYGTDQIYFKSAKEMCNLFSEFPEAIKSTLEVTEKCNLELNLNQKHMPDFPIPAESKAKNLNEYLAIITKEGMHKRIKDITPDIEERSKHELEIIEQMDFPGYFLIVADFIKSARERGILVGPGRGSAAGSLVCYCLGITNVNPLDYNLLFERFLNPQRISMPDIDIDFQDDRRDEVIQYAKQKYGENSVAQIVTFNKLAPRGVLKDVGRVLNFPFNEINDLTKVIPIVFGKVKPLKECISEVPDFSKYFNSGTPAEKYDKKNLLEYASVLENLNKNASLHASGIVVAPSDVTDYVPLSKVVGVDNIFCTQYDMNQLEDAGLIKIDFLGLKELKVISKTLSLINKKHNLNLTPEDIPLDDEKTYELFSNGATIGVFQFSNSKMREYLSKLKPKNITDLAAMNALYRPGPMNLIPEFIDKRFGRKPYAYLHPKMENALKETYGIIVYQEQVMQIAREVAGFSMEQADNMRKAMGKKIKEKMKQIKDEFMKGADKNGVSKKIANEIFELMFKFADYGFNKSHAVAYSILAFYTAYLKTHYPLEFLAVSMESRKDDETEVQLLAEECRKMNIILKQPDVNSSFLDFKTEYVTRGVGAGNIIYGLSAIKNVGEKAAESIVKEREENGNYDSFIDFLTRVDLRIVNKKSLESLIFAGAFDNLEPNRNKLYCNLERATLYAQRYKDTPESNGQEALFVSDSGLPKKHDLILIGFEEFPETEKFNREKSVLGFYLSGHPLEKYRSLIKNFVNLHFGDDVSEIDFSKLGNVKMCGAISNLQVKSSKKGNRFAVFHLIDFYGTGECVAFSKLYDAKTRLFENDKLVFVEGKAEENGDKIKLLVENIHSIETFQLQYAHNISLSIGHSLINDGLISELKALFKANPGSCNVFINVINNSESKVYRSKEFRVEPTSELIIKLKNLIGENNLNIN